MLVRSWRDHRRATSDGAAYVHGLTVDDVSAIIGAAAEVIPHSCKGAHGVAGRKPVHGARRITRIKGTSGSKGPRESKGPRGSAMPRGLAGRCRGGSANPSIGLMDKR